MMYQMIDIVNFQRVRIGNLPSVDIFIAKDKDGEIWVGTGEGIAVFYVGINI